MRRRLHIAAIIMTLAGVGALAACSRDGAEETPAPELVGVVESGPVTLRVESDRDTIRTVDRAEIRVRVTLEPGATLTGLTIDEGAEDWTVIEDRDEPERRLDDGGALLARTLTLEPFLDGEYSIPSVSAAWAKGEASGVAVSDPMLVRVESVLDEDDPLVIGEARSIPPAEAEPAARARTPMLIAIVAGGGLAVVLAAGLVWWRARRGTPDPAAVALARIERAAQSGDPGAEACAEAAEALRVIAGDGSARELIDRLDDARFSPEPEPERVAGLVRDAASVCRSVIAARGARA